jgi:ribonuclease HII
MYNIGVDEAGRGPMFGRVYAAAVVLPKDFDTSILKDSKKFHSKRKIDAVAAEIRKNAVAYHVSYETEETIDKINILQATQKAMHAAILHTMTDLDDVHLLIDGNYFNPLTAFDKQKQIFYTVPHTCVEKGDDKIHEIMAASILAKVGRDAYIAELCEQHNELITNYGIDKNKGYGTKRHLDGIREHGITKWHRKSFGICKEK